MLNSTGLPCVCFMIHVNIRIIIEIIIYVYALEHLAVCSHLLHVSKLAPWLFMSLRMH